MARNCQAAGTTPGVSDANRTASPSTSHRLPGAKIPWCGLARAGGFAAERIAGILTTLGVSFHELTKPLGSRSCLVICLAQRAATGLVAGMPFRGLFRLSLAFGLALASANAAVPVAATPLTGVAWPTLSPDGNTIVFEWCDDLWRASVEGGEAIRLTTHPARDTRPHFTPDGKRVVFSSNRSGSFQVFSMAASGGEPIQHSHHSEGGLIE